MFYLPGLLEDFSSGADYLGNRWKEGIGQKCHVGRKESLAVPSE
jgi:hypothetical protein